MGRHTWIFFLNWCDISWNKKKLLFFFFFSLHLEKGRRDPPKNLKQICTWTANRHLFLLLLWQYFRKPCKTHVKFIHLYHLKKSYLILSCEPTSYTKPVSYKDIAEHLIVLTGLMCLCVNSGNFWRAWIRENIKYRIEYRIYCGDLKVKPHKTVEMWASDVYWIPYEIPLVLVSLHANNLALQLPFPNKQTLSDINSNNAPLLW